MNLLRELRAVRTLRFTLKEDVFIGFPVDAKVEWCVLQDMVDFYHIILVVVILMHLQQLLHDFFGLSLDASDSLDFSSHPFHMLCRIFFDYLQQGELVNDISF